MTITHLERRRIEAGVLIPLVQAFQHAFGKEQANEVVREVIRALAREDGSRWAGQFGAGLDRADCRLRDFVGRHGKVRRHRGRMDRPGHRAGDDDFSLGSRHASDSNL